VHCSCSDGGGNSGGSSNSGGSNTGGINSNSCGGSSSNSCSKQHIESSSGARPQLFYGLPPNSHQLLKFETDLWFYTLYPPLPLPLCGVHPKVLNEKRKKPRVNNNNSGGGCGGI